MAHSASTSSALSRRSSALVAATALLFSTAFLSGVAAEKGGLLWPLAFRDGVSSSFGEYRSTHFHMGIDLRTRQQEGWPVLAVGDGVVARIRREPDGYGRVLYLTLKDGRTVVYGHLCRFSKELGIEARLQAACASKGTSFPGDVMIDPPIPVRRGQEVARSGQLGLGAPHLHFEVRNGDDACDPFLSGLELPQGMSPPQVSGLLFLPRDETGSVEGSFRPLFVAASPVGKDRARLPRRVDLRGAVDIRLAGRDHLGLPGNSTGIPSIRAEVDGKPFYTMDLRCVSFARYKQSTLLFDAKFLPASTPGYLLRSPPAMELGGIEGAGLPMDLSPGEHTLTVTATNRAELSTTLEGSFRTGFAEAEPRSPLALPGGGYSLSDVEALPSGLWLTLHRKSTAGVTPLLWAGRPVDGMRVETDGGQVHVLLPRTSAPEGGGSLTAGGTTLAHAAGAGPCTLEAGSWSLQVPAGGVGTLDPRGRSTGGAGVLARCGPAAVRSAARLLWKGAPQGRTGVAFSDKWLRGLDEKPIPFRAEGVYSLLEDRSAPRWGAVSLATVPNLNAREARIPLTDNLSGPDLHTLRVELDGQPVYPDWDSEAHLIRLDLDGIPSGKHTLTATCADRAGNRATLPPLTFTVSPARP